MFLASIDFDFLIVLFWIFVFFLGPIIKAIRKNKSESHADLDTSTDSQVDYRKENNSPSHQTPSKSIRTNNGKTPRNLREFFDDLIEENNTNSTIDAHVALDEVPSLPDETVTKKPKRRNLAPIEESTDNKKKEKASYKIKTNEDFKKAFVWSEILNRKYT